MDLQTSKEQYQNAGILTAMMLICALGVYLWDGARTTGKVFGFLAVFLLLVSALMGLRMAWMKRLLLKFGLKGSLKVNFHCWLSFILIEAAILHGATHMIRKETNFLDRFDVILGMVSAVFMLVVAFNGLLQRTLVKRFGFQTWYLTHLLGSMVALGADLIHVFYAEGII